MIYCQQCNFWNLDNAHYCKNCGTPLNASFKAHPSESGKSSPTGSSSQNSTQRWRLALGISGGFLFLAIVGVLLVYFFIFVPKSKELIESQTMPDRFKSSPNQVDPSPASPAKDNQSPVYNLSKTPFGSSALEEKEVSELMQQERDHSTSIFSTVSLDPRMKTMTHDVSGSQPANSGPYETAMSSRNRVLPDAKQNHSTIQSNESGSTTSARAKPAESSTSNKLGENETDTKPIQSVKTTAVKATTKSTKKASATKPKKDAKADPAPQAIMIAHKVMQDAHKVMQEGKASVRSVQDADKNLNPSSIEAIEVHQTQAASTDKNADLPDSKKNATPPTTKTNALPSKNVPAKTAEKRDQGIQPITAIPTNPETTKIAPTMDTQGWQINEPLPQMMGSDIYAIQFGAYSDKLLADERKKDLNSIKPDFAISVIQRGSIFIIVTGKPLSLTDAEEWRDRFTHLGYECFVRKIKT